MNKNIAPRQFIESGIVAILVGLGALTLSLASSAEEGGTGHYAAGSVATLIDLVPTAPGWIVQPLFLHYDGDAGKSETLPIANLVASEVEATIDAFTLGGFYTFEQPVLSYILPTQAGTGVIEARWLAELDTKHRLEGDFFWIKAAWDF